MMSKDYQWPAGKRGLLNDAQMAYSPEQTLRVASVEVERKRFVVALKENAQGKFVRITEESGGHYNRIIIPFSGLEGLRKALEQVQASAESPNPPSPPQYPQKEKAVPEDQNRPE